MPQPPGKTRRSRNKHDAFAPVKRKLIHVPDFTRAQRMVMIAFVVLLVGAWIAWFVYTRPVRGELGRVAKYLEEQPDLEHIDMTIPWFTNVMPGEVEFLALGIPTEKFDYDVRVELKGKYDTKTRVATVIGSKQVLFPYTKALIKKSVTVPKFE